MMQKAIKHEAENFDSDPAIFVYILDHVTIVPFPIDCAEKSLVQSQGGIRTGCARYGYDHQCCCW